MILALMLAMCPVCTNYTFGIPCKPEVVKTDPIGKRYEVEPHHVNGDGWEIMVRYANIYVKPGDPTDTSMYDHDKCWCGGRWYFKTNGVFECAIVTERMKINCCTCKNDYYETNSMIKVIGGVK